MQKLFAALTVAIREFEDPANQVWTARQLAIMPTRKQVWEQTMIHIVTTTDKFIVERFKSWLLKASCKSLESEFKLRNLLVENEDAEGLLHYDPKVIVPVLWVTKYIIFKISMHSMHDIDVKHSF